MQETENAAPPGTDIETLDASLADAKVRFSKTDLSVTPPLEPMVSDQARDLQQLRAQLFDAERLALRAQKAASDYREQLTEAQADIANMKSRWYAAEKARNAVSSQREVDSSGLSTQLIRAQKELERAQQLASSDMERAAMRIRTLEDRLEKALRSTAIAENSQVQYRKRSNRSLTIGVSVAAILAGFLIYEKLSHGTAAAEPSGSETSIASGARPISSSGSSGKPRRVTPSFPLEALSQRPYVPKPATRNLPDALGNLDRALKALPGLAPEDVIKQVRNKQSTPERPVCQFDWADGGPSMVFDHAAKGKSMEKWALAISACADAVNQAH
jgi:hypothetical protein